MTKPVAETDAVAPNPPVESDVLREVALNIADDLIAICETATRVAQRTGNTFVVDRQRTASMIAGRLAALSTPRTQSEPVAQSHFDAAWYELERLGFNKDGRISGTSIHVGSVIAIVLGATTRGSGT